jgi:nicotinic acid mononucleotide adenylyltransferase/biopolymer transport protein ExbD
MFKHLNTDIYYSKLLETTNDEDILLKAGYIDENFILNEKEINKLYTPINKLKKIKSSSPIVLVSTGAFNPIHEGHIKMMELAEEKLIQEGYEVIGGYFSFAHDSYVKTKVYKDYEILKRFGKSIEIISNSKYSFSLFCAVCIDFDINFTKVINYFEKYLQKYVNKNIKVCYVYGSDNKNFRHLFNCNDTLLFCCVSRPNYQLEKTFKNVLNVYKYSLEKSSTEIRENSKLNIEESKNNKIQKIYLKDDGFYSLLDLKLKDNNIYYENFKNDMYLLFKNYFNEVEIIHHKFQNLESNTISLDEIENRKYNLEITRVFELDLHNKSPKYISNRINTKNLTKQINEIKNNYYNNEFYLYDDDSASGFTISSIIKILQKNQIKIIDCKFNQSISLNEDICDIRDFLIGSKGSGLTIKHKNKKYKLPYIFPFVNLNYRSSIEYDKMLEFSKNIVLLNINFYQNFDYKLYEINKNLYYFFHNLGIKKDISMIDFLLYLNTYYETKN